MSSDWTELYRPKTLDEVVGNPKATEELKEWARSWELGKPKKKAAVLVGTPGTGKTSAALALARDFGWSVVEMNASDQRNAESIKNIALRGALSDTFSLDGEFLSRKEGKRKLIILDEADNIAGREDRGGVPAMADLIKNTKQPVIMIVNDFYALSRKSSVIKSQTEQIKFNRIKSVTVRSVLRKIAKDQGILISDKALEKISEHSNGDLRSGLRDLQAVALGRKEVSEEGTNVLSDRDVSKTMYAVMGDVLKGTEPAKARRSMRDLDESPDHIMLWIDENLPIEYKDAGDLFRGFDVLSRADIFLGRVTRRNHYRFWAYATDLMSYGINTAKRKPNHGYARYNFPTYLMKMSRSKSQRTLQNGVAAKIAKACHTSIRGATEDILPYFRPLYQNNEEFRIRTSLDLDLEQEEIAYLLQEKVDSSRVKQLVSNLQKIKDEVPKRPREEEEVEEEASSPLNQKNIFQY